MSGLHHTNSFIFYDYKWILIFIVNYRSKGKLKNECVTSIVRDIRCRVEQLVYAVATVAKIVIYFKIRKNKIWILKKFTFLLRKNHCFEHAFELRHPHRGTSPQVSLKKLFCNHSHYLTIKINNIMNTNFNSLFKTFPCHLNQLFWSFTHLANKQGFV